MLNTTTVNTQEKVMHLDLFGSTVGTGSAIFSQEFWEKYEKPGDSCGWYIWKLAGFGQKMERAKSLGSLITCTTILLSFKEIYTTPWHHMDLGALYCPELCWEGNPPPVTGHGEAGRPCLIYGVPQEEGWACEKLGSGTSAVGWVQVYSHISWFSNVFNDVL